MLRKKSWLLWLMLILAVFVMMSGGGGCGGGGESEDSPDTPIEDPADPGNPSDPTDPGNPEDTYDYSVKHYEIASATANPNAETVVTSPAGTVFPGVEVRIPADSNSSSVTANAVSDPPLFIEDYAFVTRTVAVDIDGSPNFGGQKITVSIPYRDDELQIIKASDESKFEARFYDGSSWKVLDISSIDKEGKKFSVEIAEGGIVAIVYPLPKIGDALQSVGANTSAAAKYNSAPQPGDTLITKSKNDSWTPGHVGIYEKYENGVHYVIEAVPSKGVKRGAYADLNQFGEDYVGAFYPTGITDAQRQAAVNFAVSKIGTPYGFLQYIGFDAGYLHEDFVKGQYVSFNCVGLVEAAYEHAGINGGKGMVDVSRENSAELFVKTAPEEISDSYVSWESAIEHEINIIGLTGVYISTGEREFTIATGVELGAALTPMKYYIALAGDNTSTDPPVPPAPPAFPDPPVTDGNWIDAADTDWYDNNPNAAEFTISTAQELAGLAKIVNSGTDMFSGKTIHLANNINLAGKKWTPIRYSSSSFYGTFDGGGHTIANMTVIEESSNSGTGGLFGGNRGTLEGIRLTDVYVFSYASYAGGLVGLNNGTITNCTSSGAVYSTAATYDSASYAGGLIGYNYNSGTITDCMSSGAVSSTAAANSYAGGLVGLNVGNVTITNCTSSGAVYSTTTATVTATTDSYAGGLVGLNVGNGTITDCTSSGKNISATAESGTAYRGGFIGYLQSVNTLTGNRNNTGISPAIGYDSRLDPPDPSDDI